MASIIEFHILQNFAPSNLNRDDTNTPKTTYFGGVRRARISSQCLKRQIRTSAEFTSLIESKGGDSGKRTLRVIREIVTALVEAGKPEKEAKAVTVAVLEAVGIKPAKPRKKENKDDNANADAAEDSYANTEYLLYLGLNDIEELVRVAREYWDELLLDKKNRKKDIQKEIVKKVKEAFNKKSYAADIALFGRMIADNKDLNVDASCQVAHALSTNEVKMESDYFTAVDDFLMGEEQGAGMISNMYFNSSCFYRYAQINLNMLSHNLGGDADMVLATTEGFLRAAISAVPTSKQNSTAAQNPPCYIKVVVRESGSPCSLANAFVKPVRINDKDQSDLEFESALRLEDFHKNLSAMYGDDGVVFDGSATYLQGDTTNKLTAENSSVADLVHASVNAVRSVTGSA